LLRNLKPRNASAAVLIDMDNQLGLQLRDSRLDIFFPSRWGLFGGAIEQSETPLQAVKREVNEELSLDIDETRFTQVGSLECTVGDLSIMRYFFCLNIQQSEVVSIKLTEGEKVDFFSPDQISQLKLTPYDEYFLTLNLANIFGKVERTDGQIRI
jgi:8-oxo-dGTP pyrophosphatase MutT (NUDIX family)